MRAIGSRFAAAALLPVLVGSLVQGQTQGPDGRALLDAVRRGDRAQVRALIRAGANVDASDASGGTALIEAALKGDRGLAQTLIEAGATLDTRSKAFGTALDAAQLRDHRDVVELLRARGARGSGRSVGDEICVKRWGGSGFCGVIQRAESSSYQLRITTIAGCGAGCEPDGDCSEGRWVGGQRPESLSVDAAVAIRSWCVTHTFPSARR